MMPAAAWELDDVIFYKCKYNGCPNPGPRCGHPLWFQVKSAKLKVNERGPITKYLFLWPVGRPVPQTKTEARELERLIEAWVANGRPAPTTPPSGPSAPSSPSTDPGVSSTHTQTDTPPDTPAAIDCAVAIDAYKRAVLAKSSDRNAATYEKRLRAFWSGRPLSALWDAPTVRAFLDTVTAPVAQNRTRTTLIHFAAFVTSDYGVTGPSPFYDRTGNRGGHKRNKESDGRARRLFPGEERALLKAAAKRDDGGQMVGRVYCALDAGLRRGEMLGIRKSDLVRTHNGERGLWIRVRWTVAKTSKTRHVPVGAARLRDFLNARAFAEFPFGDATGARVDSFRIDWEALLIDAGIETGEWERAVTATGKRYGRWKRTTDPARELHWHDLRHECGSRLAEKNVPPHEIAEFMGHASTDTTDKYLNVRSQSLARNVRRAHGKRSA